ncbi:MAG: hypothetical protein ACI4JZ_09340, partial [Oscillospiraceae bacterium]
NHICGFSPTKSRGKQRVFDEICTISDSKKARFKPHLWLFSGLLLDIKVWICRRLLAKLLRARLLLSTVYVFAEDLVSQFLRQS